MVGYCQIDTCFSNINFMLFHLGKIAEGRDYCIGLFVVLTFCKIQVRYYHGGVVNLNMTNPEMVGKC